MLPSMSVASDPSAYHTGSQRRPQPDAAPSRPPAGERTIRTLGPLKRDPFDFARHESARTSKLYDGRNDQVLDPASFKPGNGAKELKFINKSVGEFKSRCCRVHIPGDTELCQERLRSRARFRSGVTS